MERFLCLVCGSTTEHATGFGVVSPWIRDLGVTSDRSTKLLQCTVCGFSRFTCIYTPAGMAALYADYRGPNYIATRHKWEEWYTPEYNAAHESEWWIDSRTKWIRRVLAENGALESLDETHLVDIGGDTGAIASRLGAASFAVREVSSRASRSSPGSSRKAKFELAICTHVIEHVDNPFEFIDNLVDEFASIYLEVPMGVPSLTWVRRSKLVNLLAVAASTHPALWRKLTSPSAGRVSKFLQPLRQSEHLTFYHPGHISGYLGSKWGSALMVKESIGEITAPDGSVVRSLSVFIRKLSSQTA